ncbi:hypothetical protein LVJ83_09190 [Uruburuella testudinis]|uniref:Uncharacterized protein n=1 Tax=Uruburuella testudinis TaxID=1282863 RepID=A0ABY4DQZ0_9NEIS|nr:hypothetical protein [Uruburuella testudinis]UOO81149.1 hypothetical protein LVJ83_09190 [Uruburuella testudinis]
MPNDFGRLKHVGFEHPTHIVYRMDSVHKNLAPYTGRLKKCFQTAFYHAQ